MAIDTKIEPNVNHSIQTAVTKYYRPYETTDVKSIAKVILDSNYERSAKNRVFLSPQLFSNLFQDQVKTNYFVSVANRVFRASKDPTLDNCKAMFSDIVYRQIVDALIDNKNGEETVIRPFDPTKHAVADIKRVRFTVLQGGVLNTMKKGDRKPAILEGSLEKLVRQQCGEQLLVKDQELFVLHPVVGPLKIVVEKWDYEGSNENESLTADELPFFGEFNFETEIEFNYPRNSEFQIIKEIDPNKLSKFYFRIVDIEYIAQREFGVSPSDLGKNAWKSGGTPLPIMANLDDIAATLRERLGDELNRIDDKIKIEASPEWVYKMTLDRVTMKRGVKEEGSYDQPNIDKGFRLQKQHDITIVSTDDVILTRTGKNLRTADSITLEIIDRDSDIELGNNQFAWVSVDELVKMLRESGELIAIGSRLVVELENQTLLIEVKKISASGQGKMRKGGTKPVWKIGENTDIKLYRAGRVRLELFDSHKPFKVDTMKVEVAVPSTGQGGGIFKMLFGNDDSSEQKIRISSEDIEKVFRYALPRDNLLHLEQLITDITDKGDKVKFTIKEINSSQKDGMKLNYDALYSIDEDTKITLVGEKDGNLVITLKPIDLDAVDVSRKLRELGIGGLSDQFKDIIGKIILSKGKYAVHTKLIGQKPPRGILLSGPPGTGKTILARKLGNILGISLENTQLITGSNIWTKYVGDSEKKVRELFAAARHDQQTLGKESPMHLLIIDEIDAFLQSRENATQRYETSVLTTFLAELDGISGQGDGSLDNIIVVGLTNHPDKLDSAVTRPGRLGTMIHIGIPDKDGRKEILEIHTKDIRKEGFLSPDFDYEKIAKLTIGKTGAFIEDLVRIAASYSLKRLFENGVDAEKINGHPDSLVRTEDFVAGFDELLNKDKKIKSAQEKFVPQQMVSREAVIADLKKLNIVGLPENILEFLVDLKLRYAFRGDLMNLNHPFPKGIFLYGPSGAGKTKLVKGMKDLFGLDGQRFQYYSASQLFPLKPDALKDKIERMIKPAKDSAVDLKDEAQLHVVVIDEIDWMYWMQGKCKETHDLSILNNFIKELEAGLEDSGGGLPNLMVIGVGRRGFKMPDSILSHGRFGKHIDMGYPNASGRFDILKHLLEKHLEKGLVEESVLKEIVMMTKDRSPAFLEGLVGESDICWLRRAGMDGKMCLEDFKDAYLKMTRDEANLSYMM